MATVCGIGDVAAFEQHFKAHSAALTRPGDLVDLQTRQPPRFPAARTESLTVPGCLVATRWLPIGGHIEGDSLGRRLASARLAIDLRSLRCVESRRVLKYAEYRCSGDHHVSGHQGNSCFKAASYRDASAFTSCGLAFMSPLPFEVLEASL